MIDQIPADITKADWPPVMPWREFAGWIRVEVGVVQGWVERGYLPTVTIGKRRMVNVVALIEQLKGANHD